MAHTSPEQRNSDQPRSGGAVDGRFRRFLDDDSSGGATGECEPPLDVLETAEAIEILMDVPGLAADSVRLIVCQGAIIIAGRKLPAICAHRDAAFHLAERGFGRFARAVRLPGAFDAGRASASLVGGELRVILPRIEERRGREIRIEIT